MRTWHLVPTLTSPRQPPSLPVTLPGAAHDRVPAHIRGTTGHARAAAVPHVVTFPSLDYTPARQSSSVSRSDRRTFLRYAGGLGLSVAGLGIPSSACGLLPGRGAANVPRIGYLGLGPREARAATVVDHFLQGLRELGYVEGETVAIEWRFGPPGLGDAPWPTLATDLVGLPIDIIVADNTAAALAAKQVTSTIPIVALAVAYPLESGLIASPARPGGNLTALAGVRPGQDAKHFELLRAVVPGLTGTVHLNAVTTPTASWEEFRAAAESAGVGVQRILLRSADEVEAAFALPVVGAAQAINIGSAALLYRIRERVAQLALQHHLAAITTSGYAEKGLLMNYGAALPAINRRAAVFVDKILKGARASDLPVELPNVFDLAVNIRTAQALGLTIPPDVAMQVTQWIE